MSEGTQNVSETPEELLALAESVAREAGAILVTGQAAVTVADTKSSPTDVVTEMDRRAESLIRERIAAARPADAILGEEEGQTGDETDAPVRWVVDPLDGTVNYLYGLHDWAVSIAAEVSGKIVAGAVCVPRRGELFTAVLGGGAWLTSGVPRVPGVPGVPGEPAGSRADPGGSRSALRCGPGVALDRALVGTGFGYRAERRVVQGEVVAALLPRIRDIRRGGSAAIDLCSVAAGRLNAYYERGLNYWDWAAGALVAAEAGAMVGGLHSAPASTSMTVAAGPELFAPLTSALESLNSERDA